MMISTTQGRDIITPDIYRRIDPCFYEKAKVQIRKKCFYKLIFLTLD